MKIAIERGIPVSVSLDQTLESQHINKKVRQDKKRMLYISALAVGIGVAISLIAKVLANLN